MSAETEKRSARRVRARSAKASRSCARLRRLAHCSHVRSRLSRTCRRYWSRRSVTTLIDSLVMVVLVGFVPATQRGSGLSVTIYRISSSVTSKYWSRISRSIIRPCMGMASMTDRIFSMVRSDVGEAIVVIGSRSLSDIDRSTAANDPQPSASFSARKNPQCIPVNTLPVFPGLRPCIWPRLLHLVTKAMPNRLLGAPMHCRSDAIPGRARHIRESLEWFH